MKLQILQDGKGKNTGVFIPMEDWALIKEQYPDIENADSELPQWEKELIDNRLDSITKSPDRLKSGEHLLKLLKEKV